VKSITLFLFICSLFVFNNNQAHCFSLSSVSEISSYSNTLSVPPPVDKKYKKVKKKRKKLFRKTLKKYRQPNQTQSIGRGITFLSLSFVLLVAIIVILVLLIYGPGGWSGLALWVLGIFFMLILLVGLILFLIFGILAFANADNSHRKNNYRKRERDIPPMKNTLD
jgi:Flp pilus assembly protein TadB